MSEFALRTKTRTPSHPGELMHEVGQALHSVLRDRTAVSADMALRFAQLVGGRPELFLRMQEALDLWTARQRLGARLSRIAPVTITRRAA
jgi:plasmid maintenance system antidote protein VapI